MSLPLAEQKSIVPAMPLAGIEKEGVKIRLSLLLADRPQSLEDVELADECFKAFQVRLTDNEVFTCFSLYRDLSSSVWIAYH